VRYIVLISAMADIRSASKSTVGWWGKAVELAPSYLARSGSKWRTRSRLGRAGTFYRCGLPLGASRLTPCAWYVVAGNVHKRRQEI